MPHRLYRFALASATVLLLSPSAVMAIAPGQSDTFEDETLQGWFAGSANPVSPAVIATGGPAGAGDAYLMLQSTGAGGAGGRLVAFNAGAWAGDYLDAGVTAITMTVRNFGATDLALRLILEGGTPGQNLGSLSAVSLAAQSDWTAVTFSLAAADLDGSAFEAVMRNVTNLNLVHSPAFVVARPQAPLVAAALGIDNVSAVPEPQTAALLALGAGALLLQYARRPAVPDRKRRLQEVSS